MAEEWTAEQLHAVWNVFLAEVKGRGKGGTVRPASPTPAIAPAMGSASGTASGTTPAPSGPPGHPIPPASSTPAPSGPPPTTSGEGSSTPGAAPPVAGHGGAPTTAGGPVVSVSAPPATAGGEGACSTVRPLPGARHLVRPTSPVPYVLPGDPRLSSGRGKGNSIRGSVGRVMPPATAAGRGHPSPPPGLP